MKLEKLDQTLAPPNTTKEYICTTSINILQGFRQVFSEFLVLKIISPNNGNVSIEFFKKKNILRLDC